MSNAKPIGYRRSRVMGFGALNPSYATTPLLRHYATVTIPCSEHDVVGQPIDLPPGMDLLKGFPHPEVPYGPGREPTAA